MGSLTCTSHAKVWTAVVPDLSAFTFAKFCSRQGFLILDFEALNMDNGMLMTLAKYFRLLHLINDLLNVYRWQMIFLIHSRRIIGIYLKSIRTARQPIFRKYPVCSQCIQPKHLPFVSNQIIRTQRVLHACPPVYVHCTYTGGKVSICLRHKLGVV
jgi:hypothetical protein